MTRVIRPAERWRDDLAAWAIPDEILAAADTSPWMLPPALFARRADEQLAGPHGLSYERAVEALPEGGALLDVGAGAGAAGLPPAATRKARIIAVDISTQMLDELEARAIRLGVPVRLIEGCWPDVAADADGGVDGGGIDVAICKDVLYNVPSPVEFLSALTRLARHRVVVELTDRHPLTPLNPLWLRFHGLRRPDRPTAADAYEIATAMGASPRLDRWMRETRSPYGDFADLVEMTRIRLCLPPERSDEVAVALRELGTDPAEPYLPGTRRREVATLWWPGGRIR